MRHKDEKEEEKKRGCVAERHEVASLSCCIKEAGFKDRTREIRDNKELTVPSRNVMCKVSAWLGLCTFIRAKSPQGSSACKQWGFEESHPKKGGL